MIGAAYPRGPGFRDFPPHTKTPPIVPLGGVLCKVGSTFFASFSCMPLSSDVLDNSPNFCFSPNPYLLLLFIISCLYSEYALF